MKMNFSQLSTTLDGLLHASLLVESSFCAHTARLAQSVEHETLNLRVVGSSPTLGAILLLVSDNNFDHMHRIPLHWYPGAVA